MSTRAILLVLAAVLAAEVIAAALGFSAAAFADEVKISLDEGHKVLIVPAVSVQRMNLNFGGTSANPGQENASGLELAARLISSSNRTQSLLVGLDLRQILAQVDNLNGVNLLNTKLGIHIEYRPTIKFQPSFGAAWFFGDTIVARDRDEQFNGLSGSVYAGIRVGSARWFLEGMMGSYNQGAGFILLSRTPGSDSLSVKAVSLGVEFPIETIWPEWLKMTPPTSPVLP